MTSPFSRIQILILESTKIIPSSRERTSNVKNIELNCLVIICSLVLLAYHVALSHNLAVTYFCHLYCLIHGAKSNLENKIFIRSVSRYLWSVFAYESLSLTPREMSVPIVNRWLVLGLNFPSATFNNIPDLASKRKIKYT